MAKNDLTTPRVEDAQDILFLKIRKALDSKHRQLFQNCLEILLEGSKNQIELLESVVTVLYRQTIKSEYAGARVYTWRAGNRSPGKAREGGEGGGISTGHYERK